MPTDRRPVQLPVPWAGSAWCIPQRNVATAQMLPEPELSDFRAAPDQPLQPPRALQGPRVQRFARCVCGAKFISATVPCRALADKASPNQTAGERGGDAEPAFLFQKDEPTVSSCCCCFPGVTQPTCSTRDSRATSTGLQCSVWRSPHS